MALPSTIIMLNPNVSLQLVCLGKPLGTLVTLEPLVVVDLVHLLHVFLQLTLHLGIIHNDP